MNRKEEKEWLLRIHIDKWIFTEPLNRYDGLNNVLDEILGDGVGNREIIELSIEEGKEVARWIKDIMLKESSLLEKINSLFNLKLDIERKHKEKLEDS